MIYKHKNESTREYEYINKTHFATSLFTFLFYSYTSNYRVCHVFLGGGGGGGAKLGGGGPIL